jgi:hypothetical protein
VSLTVRLLSLCAFSRCAPSGLVDGVLPVPTRAQCCVVIWSTPHPPWTSLDQGCVGRVCDERVPSVAADDASKWNAKKPAIDALKASPMWDRSRLLSLGRLSCVCFQSRRRSYLYRMCSLSIECVLFLPLWLPCVRGSVVSGGKENRARGGSSRGSCWVALRAAVASRY